MQFKVGQKVKMLPSSVQAKRGFKEFWEEYHGQALTIRTATEDETRRDGEKYAQYLSFIETKRSGFSSLRFVLVSSDEEFE